MINSGTFLLVLLSIAALIDLYKHQIPNWLTGGGILVAFIWTFLDPVSSTSFTSALAGIAAGLACLFPIFLIGKMGAGDVKLFAMAGAYLGPLVLFWGVLFSLIAGGILASVWTLLLKLAPTQILRMVPNASSSMPSLSASQKQGKSTSARCDLASDPKRLPYALAIAIGCSLAYLGFK